MPLLPAVLSPEGLEHVATHKYVPGKYTPLDNLLNPWWLGLANALPMWLAPNLVTLLGFIPMVVSYGLAWLTAPHFDEPAPRHLALFTALATFFYQTMDALDGKQARRTGSSTPLGQLFDHGCDCMACLSHHSVASMVLLPGPSLWTVAGLTGLQTAFFCAQWQEYHTGILRTSFGPVGVTETQFFLIFLALFGTALGPERLEVVIHTKLPVPWSAEPLSAGMVVVQGWVAFTMVLSVISLGKTFAHVARERGAPGILEAMKQLVPVIAVNAICFLVWDPSVVQHHPRSLCFLTGILYFFLTAQMILFSMARMHFPTFQATLLPYGAVAVLSRFLPESQNYYVLSLSALAMGAWIFVWLDRALEELKTKLGIRAFVITPKAANANGKSQ